MCIRIYLFMYNDHNIYCSFQIYVPIPILSAAAQRLRAQLAKRTEELAASRVLFSEKLHIHMYIYIHIYIHMTIHRYNYMYVPRGYMKYCVAISKSRSLFSQLRRRS